MLTRAQAAALRHVRERAEAADGPARLAAAVAHEGAHRDPADVLRDVIDRGLVAVHFHPDRLLADGTSVVQGLRRDGRYRSQFETGVSSGGLTAHRGGDRDRWEDRLFGGAYRAADATERPVYGALDLRRHADGPSPRFGSCYLVLRADVLLRCTVTASDSGVTDPEAGVVGALDGVVASLLETGSLPTEPVPVRRGGVGRALDAYVEVQVHGPLRVPQDVAAVVVDASFRGTSAAADLGALGVPVSFHPGFALRVDEVPDDVRGPEMPRLAARLERDGVVRQDAVGSAVLDAAAVGRAAASVVRDPGSWADWGTPAESLQHLKQLWHVLVARGRPV